MPTFSHDRWVRIWFSKDPTSFLPNHCIARLQNFLQHFPQKQITLIYDSQLLCEKGKEHFDTVKNDLQHAFPAQIQFLDFSSEAFQSRLVSDQEKELYQLANIELRNLNQGGNVAAASDITRLLKPAYEQGIYTDFDIEFNTTLALESQGQFEALLPMLINKSPRDNINCSNDVLAVDAATLDNPALESTHRKILKRYTLIGLNKSYKKPSTEDITHIFVSNAYSQEIERTKSYPGHNPQLKKEYQDITEKLREYIQKAKLPEIECPEGIRKYDAITPLFQFRMACEILGKAEQNACLKLHYYFIFIKTVVYITGPCVLTIYKDSVCVGEKPEQVSLSFRQTPLGKYLLSPYETGSSDLGWIPESLKRSSHPSAQQLRMFKQESTSNESAHTGILPLVI